MFVSYLASLFYVRLLPNITSRRLARYWTRDEIWEDWTSENENGSIVEDLLGDYVIQFKLMYILGAAFFVLVGIFDWMCYCDVLNVFMILAGAAGVASGMSTAN